MCSVLSCFFDDLQRAAWHSGVWPDATGAAVLTESELESLFNEWLHFPGDLAEFITLYL